MHAEARILSYGFAVIDLLTDTIIGNILRDSYFKLSKFFRNKLYVMFSISAYTGSIMKQKKWMPLKFIQRFPFLVNEPKCVNIFKTKGTIFVLERVSWPPLDCGGQPHHFDGGPHAYTTWIENLPDPSKPRSQNQNKDQVYTQCMLFIDKLAIE